MNAQTKAAEKPKTLAAALVAAQTDLHAPTKNRTVNVPGKYKFDYATLDEITERVLRPVLPTHGLWFVQGVKDGHMITTIIHDSGEQMDAGSLPIPAFAGRPQEAGSIITYFKRYSLCAAFGLVADEDDDGTAATGETSARKAIANDTRPAPNGNGKKDTPFPQGPAKNVTELKTLGRTFWREVEGCGDGDELTALLASHTALTKQIHDALPMWWSGGTRDGEPYDGLSTVITKKQLELSIASEESGGDWKNNPLHAG